MKNILQDVILPKKGSIRDIPISRKKNNRGGNNEKNIYVSVNNKKIKNSSNRKKWWIVVVVLLVFSFVFVSYFFSGAEVNITPKQEKLELNTDLVAVRDGIKTNEEGVLFKTISVSDKESETTSNVKEKEVDKKASGKIIIFNDYNSSPQKLIINTRFETPDGLIYRISKYVIVPGKTSQGPGRAIVEVYADSPGGRYNIGLTDFTIPGFSGTSRFSKFYARSETSMSGGYSGLMKIVSDSELEAAKTDIHKKLRDNLESKIYLQLPNNYVLYKDGIFVSFESKPNVDLGDSVQISEKGTLKAVIFNKQELSDYISNNVVLGLGEGKIKISNLEDLDFKIKSKKIVDLDSGLGFTFNLKGKANFVWFFDEEKMKRNFAGHSIKDFNLILADYQGINDANVTVSPFWKTSFPESVKRIKIRDVLNNSN